METKLTNMKGCIILLAFIFASNSVYANELEEIEVNFLPSEDSEKNQNGRGLLLGGAPGVEGGIVVILGGGGDTAMDCVCVAVILLLVSKWLRMPVVP